MYGTFGRLAGSGLALALMAGATAPAAPPVVEAPARPPQAQWTPEPLPELPSARWKIGPGRTVYLVRDPGAPPVAEDGLARPMQIGMATVLEQPAQPHATDWLQLPDGSHLLRIEFAAPGAEGLALHLVDLAIPAGVELHVYDAFARRASGPAIGAAELMANGADGYWTPPEFSEEVVLEWWLPAGVDPAAVNFRIENASWLFAPLVADKAAGACNLDVTCFPEWGTAAAAVARYTFNKDGGTYKCTGTLLNNLDATTPGEPYFLSAFHCLDTQAQAGTMTLYWLYQTSTCNGNPPALNTVPRTTGGADLLATAEATDYTFVQLRMAPPGGVAFAGWSTASPPVASTIVSIHHPDGDFKRYSRGATFNPTLSQQFIGFPPERYHYVRWSQGVTEGGSSGCALLNANAQVVGNLFGGQSSCEQPTAADVYGRFSVTFSALSQWLNPATPRDDVYEPNGTLQTAYDLRSNEGQLLSVVRGRAIQRNDDWYRISTTTPLRNITVDCLFSHAEGNVDIQLYSAQGTLLAAAQTTTNNEQLTHQAPLQGEYFVRVFGANRSNLYDLRWQTTVVDETDQNAVRAILAEPIVGDVDTNDDTILDAADVVH